jgi:hypothetical protein
MNFFIADIPQLCCQVFSVPEGVRENTDDLYLIATYNLSIRVYTTVCCGHFVLMFVSLD